MDFLNIHKKNWYVIITKPGWEKKVGKNLTSLGIENLIPLQKQIRQWSDRKKVVEVPVFMTYAFVWCTPRERLNVFKAEGVRRFLSIGGTLSKVSEAEIAGIKKLLSYEKDIVVEDFSVSGFSEGQEVEIVHGCLQGLRGKVFEEPKCGKNKIKILIESLNCFACTEVTTEMLIPCSQKMPV